MHRTEPESPAALYESILPLLEAVDLNDLDPVTQGAIETAELSGTPIPENGKKLLELSCIGVITGDQCRALIDYIDG